MNTKETKEVGTKSPSAMQAPEKLMLLITIVSREKSELYAEMLQNFEINMQMFLSARGTAQRAKQFDLGTNENKKSVIVSVIRKDKVPAALAFLEEKFRTIKNGKGIAYTVPMTSTIGVAIYRFLSNSRNA